MTPDHETAAPQTTAPGQTSFQPFGQSAEHAVLNQAAGVASAAAKPAGEESEAKPAHGNGARHSSRGRTTIANEVVEKIAGIAAREVPGVFDLGGDIARAVTAVRERIHLGEESAAQGVKVKLEGRTAEVEVKIVIEFGYHVYEVADEVRDKVIASVEDMLGLEITAVNVTVDDVHIKEHELTGHEHEPAGNEKEPAGA